MKRNKTHTTRVRITPEENKIWSEQSPNKSELIRKAVNHYILFEKNDLIYNYEFFTSITKYPDGEEEENICVFLEVFGIKYEINKRANEWYYEEVGGECYDSGFCSMREAIEDILK